MRADFMRIHLLIISVLSLTFLSCNKESNPVIVNSNPIEGSLVLSGKISDYNGVFDKIFSSSYSYSDSLSVRDSAEIKTDGSFNFIIPPPPENRLYSYKPHNQISVINSDTAFFIDSVRIADSNFKYMKVGLSAQTKAAPPHLIQYSMSLNLAKITTDGESGKVGDYIISYYYSNMQTTITGYFKFSEAGSGASLEIITYYNINIQKGWNKIITRYVNDDANKSIYVINEIGADQGDWIIGANNFNNISWF
jgi:hypothetical protein